MSHDHGLRGLKILSKRYAGRRIFRVGKKILRDGFVMVDGIFLEQQLTSFDLGEHANATDKRYHRSTKSLYKETYKGGRHTCIGCTGRSTRRRFDLPQWDELSSSSSDVEPAKGMHGKPHNANGLHLIANKGNTKEDNFELFFAQGP